MNQHQHISLLEVTVDIGFLYWLREDHDMRGLKSLPIDEYPLKLKELQKLYKNKYPNGLTGWE